MKKFILFLSALLICSSGMFGQVKQIGSFYCNNLDNDDPERPWSGTYNHVRGATITDDLDGDGKREVIATDYQNGGRVHVLELNGEVLELVWSSPVNLLEGSYNPRWVQSGDLDGDGMKEIIFPTGPADDGAIQVFEFTGSDNDYGTQSIIEFPSNLHEDAGFGLYRMNREKGIVYDFDGDGKDELITCNYDGNVYILGINGNAPGFASWQVEGGDPNVHPFNRFSGGSYWQSLPCDYDGDGVEEIVNHYWNFYGFWSIEPTGTDTYTYPSRENPDAGVSGPVYLECTNPDALDAVSYMGVNSIDVDGDGKDELYGATYIGNGNPDNFKIVMMDIPSGSDGVEVWSQDNFAVLQDSLWKEVGIDNAEYWGTGAADLDGDGDDEMVICGSPGYKATVLDYNGSGSLLDFSSYTASVYPIGEPMIVTLSNYDSLGTTWTDTTFGSFVAKIEKGDINNNGKDDLVLAYQSATDTLTIKNYTWNADSVKFLEGEVVKSVNLNAINVRVIEGDDETGVKAIDLGVVTPDDYKLDQNYPNPFNPTTSIKFSLPLNKKISLKVYDMLGKEVKTLIDNEEFNKGSYEATWDATNNLGQKVASGNYIATLQYGNFSKSIKMALVK